MNELTLREQTFWQDYLRTLPETLRPKDAFIEASYAGNQEITDDLIALYLAGKKHAASSVVEDFKHVGEPLPMVGNYWIILDSRAQPKCLAKTVRVEMHKFKDVPEEIAIAEGEGDLSLEYWRQTHEALYLPHLEKWGVGDIHDATIITEFFEVLVPRNASLGV